MRGPPTRGHPLSSLLQRPPTFPQAARLFVLRAQALHACIVCILSAPPTSSLIGILNPAMLLRVLAAVRVEPSEPVVTPVALHHDTVVIAEAFTVNER